MHRNGRIRLYLHVAFVISLTCYVRCGSLNNVRVEIEPKSGDPFNLTVTGGVDRRLINNSTIQVLRIKVKDQQVPLLKVGSVQNLAKLISVEFTNCSTEVVEARAFRNLPRLRTIFLTYSDIKVIANGVFADLPSLSKIRVSSNKINVIEDEAFANIPTLSLLYVGSNQLQVWNPRWFTNSTGLEEVDFKYNLIAKIPTNAFPNLGNLSKIWLDYNDISEIEPGAFQGLRRLTHLGLTYNRLTVIQPDIFPDRMTVDTLLVDVNRLNFLSNEVLDKISVKEVAMDGNPWKCPCLDRFMFRLYQINATTLSSGKCRDARIPVCVFPDVYSQTCLEVVDEKATRLFFDKVKIAVNDLGSSKFSRCFRFD